MKLLVTTAHSTLGEHRDSPASSLGRLVQPRHYSRAVDTAREGWTWAADNDCFQGLDAPAFVRMIDALAGLPGCRFVSCPDVVGDAAATAALFDEWAHALEARGLPVALVAQDGIEREPVPWDRIDALFIGGTNDFKLGPIAADFATEAKRLGKWVHWGRVNTRRRIAHIAHTGAADSFDGSSWAIYRQAVVNHRTGERKLDQGLRWTDEFAGLALVSHARDLQFNLNGKEAQMSRTTSSTTGPAFASRTVDELRAAAKKAKIDVDGKKKADVIAALNDAMKDDEGAKKIRALLPPPGLTGEALDEFIATGKHVDEQVREARANGQGATPRSASKRAVAEAPEPSKGDENELRTWVVEQQVKVDQQLDRFAQASDTRTGLLRIRQSLRQTRKALG